MKRKKEGKRRYNSNGHSSPTPASVRSIEDIARAERSVVHWCAMKVQLHFVQALVVLALLHSKLYVGKANGRRSASVASVETRATFVGKNSGATKLLQRKKGMKYKGSSARVDGELEKQEATRSDEEKSSEADAQARREIPQEEQIQSRRLRRSGNRINQMKITKVVGDDFVNLSEKQKTVENKIRSSETISKSQVRNKRLLRRTKQGRRRRFHKSQVRNKDG